MKVHRIEEFTSWYIGNFEPSLFKTPDFEIAYKKFKKGEKELEHFHLLSTEFTLIVCGSARMYFPEIEDGFAQYLVEGDICIVEPGDVAGFEALSDCNLIIVKIPGNGWKDKYLAS